MKDLERGRRARHPGDRGIWAVISCAGMVTHAGTCSVPSAKVQISF